VADGVRRAGRGVRTTRYIQIGMLVLLGVCFAQVGWWLIDQARYTSRVRERVVRHYEEDVRAAEGLLREGVDPAMVERVLPHVEVLDGGVRARVAERALTHLDEERLRRLNQYGWEGLFFLGVLAACMVILFRAIRRDAALRRRQQNFLASVSHEFKSPLASLKLSAETLGLRDPDPEGRRRLVGRMVEDIDRLESMVTNILDTARLEEGQAHLHPESVRLAEVVFGTLEASRSQVDAERVALSAEVPAELCVQADPHALRAILRNLVDNAVKATAAKGGGCVSIAAARNGAGVQLEVADDGVGFAPEERVNIFRKFYRPGDELRRKQRGSGLGLYLVRRLVELHRGRVSARSDGPGCGAVFTVVLPEAKEESP
jgi:signal transduction histidine kinase